jgi:hypothetical protein
MNPWRELASVILILPRQLPTRYPNGNTGREIDEDGPPVVARSTIYPDAEHPSAVILPIILRIPAAATSH